MQSWSHRVLQTGFHGGGLILVLLASSPRPPALNWALDETAAHTSGDAAAGLAAATTQLPIDPAAIAALRREGTHLPSATLPLLDGGSLELPFKPAKPTVVAVFAAWCDPCLAEAVAVEASAKRNPQARFVGLDVLESAEHARAFVRQAGVSFPTALVTNAAFSKADVTDDERAQTGVDIPAVYVLDAHGVSKRAFVGSDPHVAAKIDEALSSLRAP